MIKKILLTLALAGCVETPLSGTVEEKIHEPAKIVTKCDEELHFPFLSEAKCDMYLVKEKYILVVERKIPGPLGTTLHPRIQVREELYNNTKVGEVIPKVEAVRIIVPDIYLGNSVSVDKICSQND